MLRRCANLPFFFSNNHKLYIYLVSEIKLNIYVRKVKLCFNILLHMIIARNYGRKIQSINCLLSICCEYREEVIIHSCVVWPQCSNGTDRIASESMVRWLRIKNDSGRFSGLFYDTSIVETAVKQAFIFTLYKCRMLSLHQSTETHKQETNWKRNVDIRGYATRSELPEVLLCKSQGETPVIS